MTELSFLIELLLNHELPKPTKDLIASRIKEVEGRLTQYPQSIPYMQAAQPVKTTLSQAPSTLALMAKYGDIVHSTIPIPVPQMPPVIPVEQVAQTPATAAAMNSRNEAIAQALSGKPEKGATRPRKF